MYILRILHVSTWAQKIFFTIINTDGAQRGRLYIWIVYKRSFEMVWFLPLSLVEIIKNIQLVSSKRNCYIMTVQLDIVITMLVVSMNQYFYWQSLFCFLPPLYQWQVIEFTK